MKILMTVLLTITFTFSVFAQKESKPPQDPYGIMEGNEKVAQVTSLVKYVRVDKSGAGYVFFVTPLVNTPASCGSSYPNVLAFDTTTDGGKSILSVVLTAKATSKRVVAYGSGFCDIYSVIETWNYGLVIDS